ncbi:unnamed protein product [Pleuronectes platessa]|uniref:Uncharacterized protein n=1 Tax=Pleuronectes platessa TaxID=8262 RepID=A0A9N7W120_PLEPL|nr:unnamed protein product [Pleuronectes platessa]
MHSATLGLKPKPLVDSRVWSVDMSSSLMDVGGTHSLCQDNQPMQEADDHHHHHRLIGIDSDVNARREDTGSLAEQSTNQRARGSRRDTPVLLPDLHRTPSDLLTFSRGAAGRQQEILRRIHRSRPNVWFRPEGTHPGLQVRLTRNQQTGSLWTNCTRRLFVDMQRRGQLERLRSRECDSCSRQSRDLLTSAAARDRDVFVLFENVAPPLRPTPPPPLVKPQILPSGGLQTLKAILGGEDRSSSVFTSQYRYFNLNSSSSSSSSSSSLYLYSQGRAASLSSVPKVLCKHQPHPVPGPVRDVMKSQHTSGRLSEDPRYRLHLPLNDPPERGRGGGGGGGRGGGGGGGGGGGRRK